MCPLNGPIKEYVGTMVTWDPWQRRKMYWLCINENIKNYDYLSAGPYGITLLARMPHCN